MLSPAPAKEIAVYHVSQKILLKKDGAYLFLLDNTRNKFLDLPGGRIDTDEHEIPLAESLDREIKEELGQTLRYKLNHPIMQFRRHRFDLNLHIFIVVNAADYLEGDIQLSKEHGGFQWVIPSEFHTLEKERFFNDEEYQAFKTYFDSL